MERATIFLNVDKKITPSWAFPLSPFVYCCQTPALSAGIAQARPGDTADTLTGRADAALYQAKNCGRNRAVTG